MVLCPRVILNYKVRRWAQSCLRTFSSRNWPTGPRDFQWASQWPSRDLRLILAVNNKSSMPLLRRPCKSFPRANRFLTAPLPWRSYEFFASMRLCPLLLVSAQVFLWILFLGLILIRSGPAITSSNLDAVFGISCPVTEDGKQHWGALSIFSFLIPVKVTRMIYFARSHYHGLGKIQTHKYHHLFNIAQTHQDNRWLQRCHQVLQLLLPEFHQRLTTMGCYWCSLGWGVYSFHAPPKSGDWPEFNWELSGWYGGLVPNGFATLSRSFE